MNPVSAVQSVNKLVDVAGIEPANRRPPACKLGRGAEKPNLNRCSGCAYLIFHQNQLFQLPPSCSKIPFSNALGGFYFTQASPDA